MQIKHLCKTVPDGTLSSKMPPEADMAFVIIQLLSPTFKNFMASLLTKHTRMNEKLIG
jgi:hypothetical protein